VAQVFGVASSKLAAGLAAGGMPAGFPQALLQQLQGYDASALAQLQTQLQSVVAQQPARPAAGAGAPKSWMDVASPGESRKKNYDGEGDPSDNLYVMGLPKEFDTESVQQFFGAIGTVVQCKSFGNGYALVRFASVAEATTVKNSLNGQKPVGCEKPLTLTFAMSKKSDWYCSKCGDLQFQKNTTCRLCGHPRDEGAIPAIGDMPGFGKAKGKGGAGGAASAPYGVPGAKSGMGKGGPMCKMADFITELVSGGIPGGDQDPEKNCVLVKGLPADTTPEHLYQIFATFGAIIPKGAVIDYNGEECAGSGSVSFLEKENADMAVLALNGIKVPSGQVLQVSRKDPNY